MDRFAHRVLGPDWSPTAQDALQQRVQAFSGGLDALVVRNFSALAYGPGRLDAFGAIFNRITETGLGIPANHRAADAPVSFPQLWSSSELSWVQWNSVTGSPLRRNTGQVIGVFGQLQLSGTPQTGLFDSSLRLDNLDQLEGFVSKLRAPPWPQALFGAIDTAKAAAGRQLYADNCAACHVIADQNGDYPRTPANPPGRRFIITHHPALSELGTDPRMVDNFLHHDIDPGSLRRYLPEVLQQQTQIPAGELLRIVVSGVIDDKLRHTGLSGEALQQLSFRLNGSRLPPMVRPAPAIYSTYRARPLDGIWASAPYLHNGSIPNLYQLLLPEQQRLQRFRVGSHQFDPLRVGLSTDSGFEFDASLPGNLNRGHSGPGYTQIRDDGGEYRDFSDAQRWALIEYLKTLH